MNTTDYINAVKAKTDTGTDYAASKLLGVTRSAMSKYKLRGTTFNEDVALKVAEILDIDPAQVLLTAYAERAKSPKAKGKRQKQH